MTAPTQRWYVWGNACLGAAPELKKPEAWASGFSVVAARATVWSSLDQLVTVQAEPSFAIVLTASEWFIDDLLVADDIRTAVAAGTVEVPL